MSKTLVLLSGGLDSSAAVAYHVTRGSQVVALFVDYGQAASTFEQIASKAIAEHYEIPWTQVVYRGINQISSEYIRGRNAVLLLIGLWEFPGDFGVISSGLHAGTDYPDSSELFLSQMQASYDIYADGRIRIDAPFIDWTKKQVIEFCREIGLPVEKTYSCEAGTLPACGRCLSCLDRALIYA